jgi:hypothetical protein
VIEFLDDGEVWLGAPVGISKQERKEFLIELRKVVEDRIARGQNPRRNYRSRHPTDKVKMADRLLETNGAKAPQHRRGNA